MRQAEETAFYAITASDGFERVLHGSKLRIPKRYPTAREITAGEAASIAQSVRDRAPAPAVNQGGAPLASQSPLIDPDELAALKAQLSVAQAKISELEPKVVRADRLLTGIVNDAAKITGASP